MSNLLSGEREEMRDELALSLEGIAVRYRVPHERIGTLKEHAIRWLERRLQYDNFWALRDVNQVRRGETIGIIGPIWRHYGAFKAQEGDAGTSGSIVTRVGFIARVVVVRHTDF